MAERDNKAERAAPAGPARCEQKGFEGICGHERPCPKHDSAPAEPAAPPPVQARPPPEDLLVEWMREQWRLRAEINAGAEGHTYENGWCDALDGVAERLGIEVGRLRAPAPPAEEKPADG